MQYCTLFIIITTYYLKMKLKLILLFTIFCNISNSQNIYGKVIDSLNLNPLSYANITYLNKNIGTNSNENGDYSLKLIDNNDKLQISFVGYEKKIINLKNIDLEKNHNLDIKLQPKIHELKEVVIAYKKREYSSIKTLGVPKKIKVKTGLPFGYEFSNYIKNPYNKKGKLKSVILNIDKREDFDYISSFNLRFYKYDSIYKCPGDEVYFENYIIEPENKTYKLKINIDSLNIDFEKNGLCVGVIILNKENINVKPMAKIAPYLNFTQTNNEILTWSRFRDKNWISSTNKLQISDKYINALIKIEVKIEK